MSKFSEEWVSAAGWDGLYEVSSHGNVRSIPRPVKTQFGVSIRGGCVLSKITAKNGYDVVNLTQKGRRKQVSVHRLVALSFFGQPPSGHECCHANGVRTDNRKENLRWDSRSGNHGDKKMHGTWQGGERNPNSRLTEDDVRRLRACNGTVELHKVADQLGVSHGCAEKARYGATWKHVEN